MSGHRLYNGVNYKREPPYQLIDVLGGMVMGAMPREEAVLMEWPIPESLI